MTKEQPDLVAEIERLKKVENKYNKLIHITERGCYQLMYLDTDRDAWTKVSIEESLKNGN